jgi:hypothetical protein
MFSMSQGSGPIKDSRRISNLSVTILEPGSEAIDDKRPVEQRRTIGDLCREQGALIMLVRRPG